MRIALVSPYSWTYPGGVTRHIEALSAELAAQGHEPDILAPYDPDDALSARLHRGARPQQVEPPANFVPLGRTIGIPANGAVSNLTGTLHSIRAIRRALRTGGYDVAHIHEPIVPLIGYDALMSSGELPLVGTFHTYSENPVSNGIGAVVFGGRWRMNRLHARIAVSEAAAWTARRFYGGRYRIVPNGVLLPVTEGGENAVTEHWESAAGEGPNAAEDGRNAAKGGRNARFASDEALRILFIGQAVERKGLPVLLRAFEALREQVPATLTLVGASLEEIAPMLLDDRGVLALGKVSEERKHAELARAEVLCAPSLRGESFGMVLTEAFAASTPVVTSNIPGYRDVARDGVEGLLVPPGDALALAEALRTLALDPARRAAMAAAARARAERFSWTHVAEEVIDTYEQAIAVGQPQTRTARMAVRYGLAPADLRPRVPARRLPSLEPAPRVRRRAVSVLSRVALLASSLMGIALAYLALQKIGVTNVAASLVASSPGLVAAGVAVMCTSMFVRGIAWHAILKAAPTWRVARRRDALQGTFIGVLMSATLPARLGEPSRALIVARRLGRPRETLPVVLGTMVSQTLLNLLALVILGGVMFSSVSFAGNHTSALLAVALAPLAALIVLLLAPVLVPRAAVSRSERLGRVLANLRAALLRVRAGLRVFRNPRQAASATALQLFAWGLQWLACWLLLAALGLTDKVGFGAAAAVLFAVNVTAVVPATPANVGVFQAACVAVLAGAYHVPSADALAYGIVLQAVEVATAVIMGTPALVNEGLSWKEVRLRTMHASPVKLGPLPGTTTHTGTRRPSGRSPSRAQS
ncbi:MAG TPA: lysylphosphatidylglycerol synthase domain-containing protein [Solirubrobacteraceae bacterium]|nr:lysylphosphatidylglycerol synthase domain-containing protein [Solirubrobacteraceae bacterium]